VKRYNGTTGAFIDTFASGSGLSVPRGLVFGPDGNLYVSSQDTNEVKRYNGTTGVFMDNFVTAGSGGLDAPFFMTFTTVIPEPGTVTLLVVGLAVLAIVCVWRKKQAMA
jgi:DNA-binding beta-propeller fold protein YncE